MEKSVSTKENGNGTPISNSGTSIIKIDSISIDLINENEKNEDVGNCKHFSIRSYVGEIRQRDRKQCWPFSMDDKHNCSGENSTCTLPPMPDAKFRWWRCQNCLRETDPQSTPKEIDAVLKCSQNGVIKSNNSVSSHMSSHKEADVSRSDCEKPIKLKIMVGRNIDTNNFVNMNGGDIGAPTCTSKRDRGGEVTDTTIKGRVIRSKGDVNHKLSECTNYMKKDDPCLKFEKNKNDNKALESKCNGFAETCKTNSGLEKADANGLATTNLNCKIKKYISEDDRSKKLMPACGISSESDEIIGEKNLLAKLQEDQSTFRRVKPRKIRLLADILSASNGSASVYKSKSDDTPSTSSGQTKKRKMPHDGVVRNSMLNKKTKKTCNGDRSPSLLPLEEVLPQGNEKRVQDTNKRNTSDTTGSTNQSNTGKAIDSVVQSVLSAKDSEKKSCLGNEKNKKPQPKNLLAFLLPWNKELLRENSTVRQNVEPMKTVEKMLDFRQENNQNSTPSIEPRTNFLLSGKEEILGDGNTRKDLGCKCVGESSSKSAANARINTELHWDLNIPAGPNIASLIRDKQNRPPRVEDGDLSTLQKKDAFGKSNSEKSVGVKEHSNFVENHSVQKGDKVFDKGSIDDIPIEIIELLAKSQYERRLKNAEKVVPILETANTPKNGKSIDVKNVPADGKLMVLPELNPDLLKSHSSSVRKQMFTNGEKTVNSVGNFPRTITPGGFQAFSRCQQKVPNEVQSNGIWTSMIQNHMSREHQTMNITSGSIKETRGKYPVACNKRFECAPQMTRSSSTYSNETIPAMHLLSLTDPCIRSVTPFKVNQKANVLQKSSLPHDQHSKEFSSDTSRYIPYIDYRKAPLAEKSCECLSAVPAFGALTSSLQNDISIRRITHCIGQASVKSGGGKGKGSYSPTLNRVPKSQKSVTNCEFSRDQSTKKKSLLGASFSIVYPPQHHKVEDSMKYIEFKAPPSHGNGTIRPVKRKPVIEICILNRNPADFSIPEAGNKYMIGRNVCSEKISALPGTDRPKKKRLIKPNAFKEHAQNQVL